MLSSDPIVRVLYIDLSRRRFWVEEHPDLFDEGLGGAGVAIRLLQQECLPGTDALGLDNPIILAVGPLVGLFPIASKTVAMFKSPHTGNLGESHAGGRSAVAIRMAGYGAIVIRGVSPSPVYLVVDEGQVHFRDASALWGVRSSYTVADVLRRREQGSGARTIMRIGRAGERQVTFACVITETYRHFGRLGLGAVFGSKRLKALMVVGRRSLAVADPKTFRKVYDDVFDKATSSQLMKKYHDLGTPMNVLPMNAIGALPTRNLQEGRFEGAEAISGESIAEKYLGRRVACAHCPVACVHLAALRIPQPKEPFFYKTSMLGYDYEPIFALGSMLGISDVPGMFKLMDEVEVQGLDAMSTGLVLAWVTEALAKGLVSEENLDGLSLQWGEADAYIEAVRRIVSQPTDLYHVLACGVAHASSVYGGTDFALAFGGNEMPGYHTGPVAHLGYLTGARHSHLDSAGYSLDQKVLTQGVELSPDRVAESLFEEECWRQVLSSLVVCFFARNVYDPDTVVRTLSALGIERSVEDLTRMGADTLRRKHAFKCREGFDASQLRIPRRILETPSALGMIDEGFMRAAIGIYMDRVS
jgi:aldehyde:ferredoxin oxidoreductase